MPEIQNNNIFDIDQKTLRTDEVKVKSLENIKKYLLETYEVSENDVEEYAQQVREGAKKIADSINNNIQNRKLSIDALRISNDDLVKQYVAKAEKDIYNGIEELGDNINSTLNNLATTLGNMNPKDSRLDESSYTSQKVAQIDNLTR